MIVPLTGAIHGGESKKLSFPVEILSKNDCLLQILPHALALKFSPATK